MKRLNQVTSMLALLAGTAMTGTAMAQDTAPQATEGEPAPQEIVVTAQRRSERLRDVPISISVVSAQQLRDSGIDKITDIATLTPGVSLPVNGLFVQPTIRGIGTTITSTGSDANVAIYVDGVYQPSQSGNIFSFNNIKEVEILKGPQGTLFGRNSTGGAILVNTLQPSRDRTEFRGSVSYGSFDEVRLLGYGNVPLGESAAFNLASVYIDDNGYARDPLLNVPVAVYHEVGLRGKFLLQPTSELSLIATGYYDKRNDTTGYSLKPLNGNVSPRTAFIPASPREVSQSYEPKGQNESWGANLTARYDGEGWGLSSLSAYSNVDGDLVSDLDRNSQNRAFALYKTGQKTFSQELNLHAALTSNINLISGLYYYHDEARQFDANFSGIITPVNGYEVLIKTNAYAAYGELNVTLGRFIFNGGLRYSSERKTLSGFRSLAPTRISDSATWNALTPRVSALYKITDTLNGYVTFSRGFKSGVYNATTPTATVSGVTQVIPPARPEYVTAYEAGFHFVRDGVTVNSSVFYYKYDDIQIQAAGVGTFATTLVYNAAAAEVYGADLDVAIPVTSGLTLRGGLAYTHATYTDFPAALLFSPLPAGGNSQSTGSANGRTLVRAPRLTANASVDYKHMVGNGEVRANATVAYTGSQFWAVDNRVKQPSFTVVNGSIGWGPSDSFWRLSVWGRNLTNELYALAIAETTAADAIAYARPRSVGARLDLQF
jgi:iron complex outermembrane receptor protein